MKTVENALEFPKIYYAKHMHGGIVGYKDKTVFVDTPVLKNMMSTFEGKPVYIGHQDVNLGRLKEEAAGYVSESFYNELDGWFWVKLVAVDDGIHKAYRDGYKVSNAYEPTKTGSSGTRFNCKYDLEILGGEYEHLAIVKNPRYEDACIMTPDEFKSYQNEQRRLINSKDQPSKGKTMKLFKNKKEEVSEIDADTMIELEGGKTMSLSQLINAVEEGEKAAAAEEEKKKAEEKKLNALDAVVKVGNSDMKVSDLVKRYNSLTEKEGKESKKTNEGDEGKEEKDPAQKDPAEEKESKKENHFEKLANAHLANDKNVIVVETHQDQLKRGKDRYGA